jgi:hypothetical protein
VDEKRNHCQVGTVSDYFLFAKWYMTNTIISDAIAQTEIKPLAVQLFTELQSASKSLLYHVGIENLSFELVDFGALSLRRGPREETERARAAEND